MKSRLQQAGLLGTDESGPAIDISIAWSVLSRLGHPARFAGRAQNGSYEYIITDSRSGDLLATGRGRSIETSICDAAINARPASGSG